jgi:O-succinylbenzoic acid--CoA ligase
MREQILNTQEELLLLNPRLPKTDLIFLKELYLKLPRLKNHIWVASSGTTAQEVKDLKLIALSREALRTSAQAVNQHLKLSSKDIWGQCLPLYHVGGLGVEFRAQLTQSKVVNLLKDEKWNPQDFAKSIEDHGVTTTSLVPTQVFDLVNQKLFPPKCLKLIIVGGGALSEKLYKEATALGWPLLQSYGMSEVCSQIATSLLEDGSENQVGPLKILPHILNYRINSEGFFELQSPALFTGIGRMTSEGPQFYDPKNAGWFTTQDQMILNGHELKLLGRGTDFIKVSGELVNLNKLREIFFNQFAHSEAWAILALPDERLGSQICLVYEKSIKLSTELENAIKEQVESFNKIVAPFERIKFIKSVELIPKSGIGKVLYSELQKKILNF